MLHDDYSTLNVTNCVIDNNNNVPHAENECAWNMHHMQHNIQSLHGERDQRIALYHGVPPAIAVEK